MHITLNSVFNIITFGAQSLKYIVSILDETSIACNKKRKLLSCDMAITCEQGSMCSFSVLGTLRLSRYSPAGGLLPSIEVCFTVSGTLAKRVGTLGLAGILTRVSSQSLSRMMDQVNS